MCSLVVFRRRRVLILVPFRGLFQAEFTRLVEENASAPPGERLTEADMLIDPGYEEMLERQGKELCEEVGGIALQLANHVFDARIWCSGGERVLMHPA